MFRNKEAGIPVVPLQQSKLSSSANRISITNTLYAGNVELAIVGRSHNQRCICSMHSTRSTLALTA